MTMMDSKGNDLTFDAWHRKANFLLKRDYGIDFVDAGLTELELRKYFGFGDSPEEFIEWYATKYNLDFKYEFTYCIRHPSHR